MAKLKLDPNLPKRAVLVCTAAEYPKMVALLESQGASMKGRRLIEISGPMEKVIKATQELFDTFRVTDVYFSSSTPQEFVEQLIQLCMANCINHAEVTVKA